MKLVNLEQIQNSAWAARETLRGLNGGGDVPLYLHWTAGRYDQLYVDYHLLVTSDGLIYQTFDDLTTLLYHTANRNKGAVGIGACCAAGASLMRGGHPKHRGYPPTERMVEALARTVAVLARSFYQLVTPENTMTHSEAADLDGYGPNSEECERWDFYEIEDRGIWVPGGELLRGKAALYERYWMANGAPWLKEKEE